MKQSTFAILFFVFVVAILLFRKKVNKQFMFEFLVNIILKHEGGYVNDPADPGGETKFGISKRAYPNLDIKNLTRIDAIAIYKRDYYDKLGVGLLDDIRLAYQYFDMGVNGGIGRAKKIMEKAVELQKQNPHLKLWKIYQDLRIDFYQSIAVGAKKKFLAGWLKRANYNIII
jgi:hypothetical protein